MRITKLVLHKFLYGLRVREMTTSQVKEHRQREIID